MSRKFKPGDIGVLLNQNGGRLLKVHSVNAGRVVEKTAFESQQKYAPVYGETEIVGPMTEREASHLLLDFEQANLVHREETYAANLKRSSAHRQAIIAHNKRMERKS